MTRLRVYGDSIEMHTDYGRRLIKIDDIVSFKKMTNKEFYFTHYMDVRIPKKKKPKRYRVSKDSYLLFQHVTKED